MRKWYTFRLAYGFFINWRHKMKSKSNIDRIVRVMHFLSYLFPCPYVKCYACTESNLTSNEGTQVIAHHYWFWNCRFAVGWGEVIIDYWRRLNHRISNMVFSDEDKSIAMNDYDEKGWNAYNIWKNHPTLRSENWFLVTKMDHGPATGFPQTKNGKDRRKYWSGGEINFLSRGGWYTHSSPHNCRGTRH